MGVNKFLQEKIFTEISPRENLYGYIIKIVLNSFLQTVPGGDHLGSWSVWSKSRISCRENP